MSDIPQDIADKMMVKCGRRCCICRRFRPIKLQVHHIHEKGEGGSNDEDNLIVTCFSCHSDVHTRVPFARRFTHEELKMHRDATIKMVSEGILPTDDTDDVDEALARILGRVQMSSHKRAVLYPESAELLIKAANFNQGRILYLRDTGGTTIAPVLVGSMDVREVAKYKRALAQLVECGLVEQISESLYEVTYDGYLVADELATPAA